MSKRLFALLVLCSVLFTTASFAATKKSERDRDRDWSGAWSAWAFQSGDLLSEGSGASSGSSGRQSGGLLKKSGPPAPEPISMPVTWNGGTGNWSNAGNWTGGEPGAGSEVTIYSGGNDTVTLDVSSTINSLTLGGASNGFTSELVDSGAQTLTIANGLTVGASGYLQLTGGTTITAGADSSNAGTIFLYNGSSLSVTGNFDNTGYAQAVDGGSFINLTGTLTNGGTFLENGGGTASIGGDLVNSGNFGVSNGSTVNIGGNATNSSSIYTQGGTLNISGGLTNSGSFYLYNSGDSATMQTLSNTGAVSVAGGATLNLTSQPGGITDVVSGSSYSITGAFTAGMNNAFYQLNSVEGTLGLYGQNFTDTPGSGTLTNTGTFYLDYGNGTGSNLTVSGNLNNSGTFYQGINYGYLGGSTLNVTGTLTNSGTFGEYYSQVANVGALNNSGNFYIDNEGYGGGAVNVAGDVTNSGSMSTQGGAFNIGGGLTNSGSFALGASGDSATMQTLSNTGAVSVAGGATLNLTSQPGGITDVVSGSSYSIAGAFTAGMNNAFYQLNSVEGTLGLYGQNFTDTPGSGTLTNTGTFFLDYGNGMGSNLTVSGNLNNSGTFYEGEQVGYLGGSTLNVTGTLTNSGTFALYYKNPTANLGALNNSGNFSINNEGYGGGVVNVAGDVTNSGSMSTQGGAFNIGGGLTNSGSFALGASGDSATMQTLSNTGAVSVAGGATLNLTSQPGGITDVVSGSSYSIAGAFTAGMNNAFYQLNSVEGTLGLYGQNFTDTPGSGTLTNTGTFFLDYGNGMGSNLTVSGNLNNSGTFYEGEQVGYLGGSTLNVTGTLTNSGTFALYYKNPTANLGALNNSGNFSINNEGYGGGVVNVAGDVTNSGSMSTQGGAFNIGGGLTNSGSFALGASGDSATMQTLSNTGAVSVAGGATLNLTSQPGGITDVVSGSSYSIAGAFTAGMNNAFYQLNSVEGTLGLYGQNFTDTPGSGTLTNTGTFFLDYGNGMGSNLTVSGNLNNSGTFYQGEQVGYLGGSTLNVTGTLTNSGTFALYYKNPTANLGALNNSGNFYVDNAGYGGGVVNVAGDVTNSGSMYTQGGAFNIGGGLTNSGSFALGASGDSATMQTLSNTGAVSVAGGATLNLTSQPGGITDVVSGSSYSIAGAFTAGMNNAFYQLNSVEGTLGLYGQNFTDTPGSGTLTNTGTFFLDYGNGMGSNLTVSGNLNNSGTFYEGEQVGYLGGSTLNVTGTLTNSGTFALYYKNPTANLGALNNSGNFYVDNAGYGGGVVNVAGDVTNSGSMYTQGGAFNIGGGLTNSGSFALGASGDSATMQTLSNTGAVSVAGGATLNLTSQPGGITDVVSGSSYSIAGAFTAGMNNAFYQLNSVEGGLGLYGQNFTITPGSGTLTNTGAFYLDYGNGMGSNLMISGNLNNSGTFYQGVQSGYLGGSTLNVTGTLTNSGTFGEYYSQVANVGPLTNSGTFYLYYGANANIAGDVTNTGTFYVDNAGYSGGVVNITGDVTNSNYMYTQGGTINAAGTLTNTGSFYLYGSGDAASFGNVDNSAAFVFDNANQTVSVTNNLTNEVSGTINLNYSGDLLQVGGTLTNKGSINASNGAAIDPLVLNNIGTINVDGMSKLVVGTGAAGLGYTQFANGTLGEMISATNYGVINIIGTATLAGTLDILLQGGYDPTPGSTYKFLTFNSNGLSGTFTTIENQTFNGGTEGWHVIYDGLDGYVELQAYCVTTCAIADAWKGGTDVWSNGNKWTVGVPGSGNDVTIYSGGSDFVTLNVGTSTINSLTLGGATNGFSSELTDGGTNQTLTILQQLVVGQQGVLNFSGSGSSITAGANSFNAGQITMSSGASLSVTGNFDNSNYANAQSGGSAINVTGTLTNEAGASFYEQGGSGTASIGSLVNNGYFYIGAGSTVDLTNQSGGITDVVAGSRFDILGNFNEGAGTNNAFENLTSIEGFAALANGQTNTITPNGGTLTIASTGTLVSALGATIQINGDVSNSGLLSTGYVYGGMNSKINITGTLTNATAGSEFALDDSGDVANVGTLNNNGYTYVGPGATLNLTNQAEGVQSVVAGSRFDILGSFNEGAGTNNGFENLTNDAGFVALANGQTNTITPNGGLLTIANTGTLVSALGATIQINGDVSNSGILATGYVYGGMNSKINITGTLTNATAGSEFALDDSGDVANVGTLNNNGYTYVGSGATLNLTNQAGGIQNVVSGSRFDILGSFNEGAGTNNGFENLTNDAGFVALANGQTNTITPNGGLLTIASTGTLDSSLGATIQINGAVSNSGILATGYVYGGMNSTVNITGALTNTAGSEFVLNDSGDVANVGGALDNSGYTYAGPGATLNVTGLLTNEGVGTLNVTGGLVTAGGGLTNYGTVNVTNGGTIDPPFLNNGGTINIDGMSKLVVGTGGMAGQGYTQLANGTLGEIIAMSGYGVINVTGAVNLAGTLDIMLQNGYDPANGTLIKFLNFTPGELTGSFGNILNDTFNNGTQYWMLVAGSGFLELEAEPTSPGGTDFWNGGTGTWSTNTQWSLGNYPTPTEDAVIYSDTQNDFVTLDLGSTTVKSLTIGGSDLTYSSELTDSGQPAQTLTITNGLTIGASGLLVLTEGSTVTAGADSSNAGYIDLENGSTLGITGNFANSGTLNTGSVGGGNTFNVTGNFNNSGSFSINGNLDLANVGSITNTGSVYIGYGTQLNLSNQPGGVTDVPGGSSWQIYASFTENSSNFGFENLSSIEGTVDLENLQIGIINPGGTGGTLTISSTGALDVGNGTGLIVEGSVDNSGYLSTGRYNVGGNLLEITGNLTNENGGTFILWNGIPNTGPPGDAVSILGAFSNSGFADVEGGSTLTVTGDVTNTGNLYTDFHNNGGGNALNFDSDLINSGFVGLEGPGDTISINLLLTNSGTFDLTGGSTATVGVDLFNSGTVDLENASTLTIYRDAYNSGTLQTSGNGGTGGNTLTIMGTLTNQLGGNFILYNNDTANIGMGMANSGFVDVEGGSTLTVSGDVTSSGSIYTDFYGNGGGNTLNFMGNLNNGGGVVELENSDTLNVGLDLTNSGTFLLAGGSTANISGNVSNQFGGLIDLENASTLTVMGNADNSGYLQTSGFGGSGGNIITITGTLTNENGGQFVLYGPSDTANIGSGSGTVLSNAGFVDLENGSTLNVTGNVTNSDSAGVSGLYTSYYSGSGFNTINITGNLDNQANANFELLGNGDVANVGTFSNEGYTLVATGATLNLTGQPMGITDAVAGSDFELYGTFTAGGNPGFANLTNVEGTVNLYGQNLTITPGGGTLTIASGGLLGVNFNPTNATGTDLTINGGVDNSGTLITGSGFTQGNTLIITGNLTNEVGGSVNIFGGGDKVTIGGDVTNNDIFQIITPGGGATVTINGSLTNNASVGLVDVEFGSTLTIKGDVTNSSGGYLAGFYTDLLNGVGGNTVNIGGSLTNEGGAIFQLGGPGDLAMLGSLDNAGTVNVDNGSTLNVTGDATNSGTIQTDPGHNTITIGGMLTNTGTFQLNGPGDMATLGSLNNSGTVDLENASSLTVNGNADNSGTLSSSFNGGTGGNTLSIDGTLTNSGTFAITGHLDSAGVGSIINNSGGLVDLEHGSSLSVTGNVTNSGEFDTSYLGQGGNVVIVNGSFTNNSGGLLQLLALKDQVTLGSLANNAGGFVDVENGATLTVNGDVTNSSGGGGKNGIFTTYNTIAGNGGATIDITGMLTNSGTFQLNGPGDMATIGNGASNSGLIDLEDGSTLKITGDVTNTGTLAIDNVSGSGSGSSLTITGMLTNSGTFQLHCGTNAASIGSLTNNAGGFVDEECGSTLTINGDVTNASGGGGAHGIFTSYNGNGGNTITVGGNLTNEATGQITLNGPGDLLQVNGAGGLTNYGSISVNNGSSIDPVVLTNGGTINIDGTSRFVVGTPIPMGGQGYIQLANGTLGEIITMSGYGVVNVTGSVTLAGTLDIMLQNGYDPANGTTIKFLNFTPGELTGTFGNILNDTFNGGTQYWALVNGSGFLELEAEPVVVGPDFWLGGADVWSNGLKWSAGVPQAGSDVTIYSDIENDVVTMNFGTTTINSLTLGGSDLTYSSELTDGGVKQTLNITNDLTVGQSGYLYLYGGSTINAGDPTNSGNIQLANGSTLAITGNLTNTSTGIVNLENASVLTVTGDVDNSGILGASLNGGGTGGNRITISGMLTNNGVFQLNGPGDMAMIGGSLVNNSSGFYLYNGSTATIGNGVTDSLSGFIYVSGGSTLTVTGNVADGGVIELNGSNNKVNISGTVTDTYQFTSFGPGNIATMTGLINSGLVDAENGSTFQINGDASNSGIIATNYFSLGGGSTINITGMLTNESTGTLQLLGPGDMATIGTPGMPTSMSNAGTVDLENGSSLTVNGTADNSGTLGASLNGGGTGGNTITITGMLTNEATGTFQLNGPGDMATVGNGMGTALANSGYVDVDGGSKLTINGAVDNFGQLLTDDQGNGGSNTITITGALTNEVGARFILNGPGDMATTDSLTNYSSAGKGAGVEVLDSSTLTITHDATNSGTVDVLGSSTLAVGGDVTNSGTLTDGIVCGPKCPPPGGGPGTVTIGGNLTSSGTVQLGDGSTLTINGKFDNSGTLNTGGNPMEPGGNTVTVTGMLTNEATGIFQLLGPGDMATVGNGVGTALANSGYVDVDGGSKLTINGAVDNSGQLLTNDQGNGGGNTITITGLLTNESTGSFTLNGPSDMATLGSLNNAGTVEVDNGSTLTINGAFDNSGSLSTSGKGGGNTITVTGLLTNEATGTITLDGGMHGDLLQALAGLSNSGVISVNNRSTIDPPFFNNLGTLNIDGTSRFVVGSPIPMGGQGYIQTSNGTLGEMIASMNSFGVIDVNGTALLDGTLAILLQNGYNPAVGSTFKFLNFTSGDLSGMFANIENDIFNNGTEKWMVDYDNADGYVELIAEQNGAPVSEPATLLVLIPGLLGMGYGLRRRLSK